MKINKFLYINLFFYILNIYGDKEFLYIKIYIYIYIYIYKDVNLIIYIIKIDFYILNIFKNISKFYLYFEYTYNKVKEFLFKN